MPEGDTVWNTARVLESGLVGQKLTGSDFRVPQLATVDLTGWSATWDRACSAWTGMPRRPSGAWRRSLPPTSPMPCSTCYVYARRAQPCRRCATAIRKAEQGERITFWCPVCQPRPR